MASWETSSLAYAHGGLETHSIPHGIPVQGENPRHDGNSHQKPNGQHNKALAPLEEERSEAGALAA